MRVRIDPVSPYLTGMKTSLKRKGKRCMIDTKRTNNKQVSIIINKNGKFFELKITND